MIVSLKNGYVTSHDVYVQVVAEPNSKSDRTKKGLIESNQIVKLLQYGYDISLA